ncbi:hypothetical protein ES708_28352 [subsurface metagenome]
MFTLSKLFMKNSLDSLLSIGSKSVILKILATDDWHLTIFSFISGIPTKIISRGKGFLDVANSSTKLFKKFANSGTFEIPFKSSNMSIIPFLLSFIVSFIFLIVGRKLSSIVRNFDGSLVNSTPIPKSLTSFI